MAGTSLNLARGGSADGPGATAKFKLPMRLVVSKDGSAAFVLEPSTQGMRLIALGGGTNQACPNNTIVVTSGNGCNHPCPEKLFGPDNCGPCTAGKKMHCV